MFGQLIHAKMLEPLDDRIDAWPGKADVIPSMWDFDKGPDGTIYSMPNKFLMFYMYYRTDLFAKYGVEVPKTQTEFVEAAKAMTHPETASTGSTFAAAPTARTSGLPSSSPVAPDFLERDGKVVFNSAEAKASNDLYISTYPDYTNPGAINDGFALIIANFQAGTASMIINHLGAAKTLDKSGLREDRRRADPVRHG